MRATSPARQCLAWWRTRHSRGRDARFEIALSAGKVIMRDTKHRDMPGLLLPAAEWRAFLRKAQGLEYDAVRRGTRTETPGEINAPGRWLTISQAIGSWSSTLRLCLILICANSSLILTAWLMLRR